MNKTSKLFAGFAALALFAACSSDEPMGNNPEGPVTPVEGQKAYLNVKINSANENSRPCHRFRHSRLHRRKR